MDRLLEAQDLARNGSLDALHGQQARMEASRRQNGDYYAPLGRSITAPPNGQRQLTYTTRQNTFPASSSSSQQRALPAPTPNFFCRYSESLQTSRRPLSLSFEPGADKRCPSCPAVIPVDTRDFWTLTVQLPDKLGIRRPVDFELDARFIVKCHVEDGRYACIFCNRFSDRDCVCRDIASLVNHLAKEHTAEDYATDLDMIRVVQQRDSFQAERSQELVLRR